MKSLYTGLTTATWAPVLVKLVELLLSLKNTYQTKITKIIIIGITYKVKRSRSLCFFSLLFDVYILIRQSSYIVSRTYAYYKQQLQHLIA